MFLLIDKLTLTTNVIEVCLILLIKYLDSKHITNNLVI